ncbi:hypothetical protein GQ457_18G021300 [Hibiscus cannabinus]
MARDGGVTWRRTEKIDRFNLSAADTAEELHVLAVDDSLVDRKVIERLLRISSCKVTAVDSGIRALQFLGLDEEKNSNGFNDLKVDLIITDYFVIMSSENVLARIDRCLEEGAEDFIVKPVKLSDVKRIKDYTTREFRVGEEERTRKGINKRKQRDSFDLSSSSPPSILSSSPVSSSSSSPESQSPSPSPPSIPSASSAPSSPSPIDSHSPTRRVKTTSSE